MPRINLSLSEEQLTKATRMATLLRVNRSTYLRQAIDHFNKETEREILAQKFKKPPRNAGMKV
jgi:hypothetical protein